MPRPPSTLPCVGTGSARVYYNWKRHVHEPNVYVLLLHCIMYDCGSMIRYMLVNMRSSESSPLQTQLTVRKRLECWTSVKIFYFLNWRVIDKIIGTWTFLKSIKIIKKKKPPTYTRRCGKRAQRSFVYYDHRRDFLRTLFKRRDRRDDESWKTRQQSKWKHNELLKT